MGQRKKRLIAIYFIFGRQGMGKTTVFRVFFILRLSYFYIREMKMAREKFVFGHIIDGCLPFSTFYDVEYTHVR